VNRYIVLYLATLIVMVPIDLVFLGLVAKGFFTSEVGDMLGEIRPLPAVLFYLLYVVGILVFVSGGERRPSSRRYSTARCSDCSAMRPSS